MTTTVELTDTDVTARVNYMQTFRKPGRNPGAMLGAVVQAEKGVKEGQCPWCRAKDVLSKGSDHINGLKCPVVRQLVDNNVMAISPLRFVDES